MKRFGWTDPSRKNSDQTPADVHIFQMHLYLLIVMVKARLKGYPAGQFRKAAIIENASFLHTACDRAAFFLLPGKQADALFKNRVKLMCIMAAAMVSQDYPLGIHRRKAVLENINTLVDTAFPRDRFPLYHEMLMAA